MKNVSIMGFDFGLRRIGVAIAHTETGTVHPLRLVEGRSNREKFDAIGTLVETWKPDLLIVGLPKKEDGSIHELWPDILRFAERLEKLAAKPVHFCDESFTSSEAEDKLRDLDIRGRRAKPHLDAVAAATMLEGLLLDASCVPYAPGMTIEDLLAPPGPLRALTGDDD